MCMQQADSPVVGTRTEWRIWENAEVSKSRIDGIRRVLSSISNLPAKLAMDDKKAENDRKNRNGESDLIKLMIEHYHPTRTFGRKFIDDYSRLDPINMIKYTKSDMDRITEPVSMYEVEFAKGDIGQKQLAELHEHLGQGETYCYYCDCVTVDRDGFYAHLVSYAQLRTVTTLMKERGRDYPVDMCTILVNTNRKDFA
ncbi:hypothetical protein PMAYCL1PPCAC_25018 [Pristionchus mayeri]|uniref:Uncharacterized protein n=1 Tax=Pristionchus mayeri TaxID=1317129 RepID=A0AAN5I731_9BILA|nr:hypothetical protein PMAYCL1PPCAC_25018 [Pristionchus mayeri]